MGSLAAAGFAEQVAEGNVSLKAAVRWHLTSNHYPPHPAFMVAPCVAAIVLAQDEEWDADVELPNGCVVHGIVIADWNEAEHATCELEPVVQWRDREDGKVRVGDIIESFRLESFL